MSLSISLGVSLTTPALGLSITIDIAPPPAFTVVDGTAISASATYQHFAADNSNILLPDGYAVSTKTITITQDDGAGLGPVEVQPAAIGEADDEIVISVEITATKADSPVLTLSPSYSTTVINVAPVATAGAFTISLLEGEDSQLVDYDQLFEPSVAGRELGNLSVTLTPAVAGVTVGASGITFDPTALALQSNTIISAFATNTSPTPSDAKAIDLTFATNTVTMTAPPTIAQGHEGGGYLELTNYDAVIDLANWPGSNPTDYVIPFSRVDGVNFSMLDTSRVLIAGEVYVFNASLWAAGTAPGNGSPRLTVSSAPMTVNEWLNVVDVNGDGTQWAFEADTVAEGGPADTLVVRGIDIDGRAINSGITAGDIRGSEAALLLTHDALAPTYTANASVGNTMTLYEPAVFGPSTGTSTRQTDVLRDGVVIETDVGASRLLVAADDGATITTRTTDTNSTASNSPLVSTSPSTVVNLADWVLTINDDGFVITSAPSLAAPTNLDAINVTDDGFTLEVS